MTNKPTVTEGDRELARKWWREAFTAGYTADFGQYEKTPPAPEQMAAEIAAHREKAVERETASWKATTEEWSRQDRVPRALLNREELRTASAEAERDALRERVAKLEPIVQRLADCTDMAEAITLKHEAAALLAPRLP